MKDSIVDQVKGTAHEAKGAVKEKVGQIINDPKLRNEGTAEKNAGKVQKKVGEVEKVIGR